MNHYFTNDPNKIQNRKTINFRFLTQLEQFISDDGVFSKDNLDFGSRALIETVLKQDLKGNVLDLGCGIGVIGILVKKYIPEIQLTMADINETAVSLATDNSKCYQQENEVVLSDSFANINKQFDVILTNPPIRTGKQNIYKMFSESIEHLKPGGRLFVVIRDKQGAASALKYLSTLASNTKVIEKNKGYWIILAQPLDNHLTSSL